MGTTMEALRPPEPIEATTPVQEIVAIVSTRCKAIGKIGGGYQLLYDTPGGPEDDDEDHAAKDCWRTTIVPTVLP